MSKVRQEAVRIGITLAIVSAMLIGAWAVYAWMIFCIHYANGTVCALPFLAFLILATWKMVGIVNERPSE